MSKEPVSISDNRFIREWREAEQDGYTHLILVTANRLRMGKSYAALRIGELLDPDFSIENVGFETLWYIERSQDLKPGSILVLDEPNRAAGNRSWYTEENRMFAEFLQTNAYRKIHGLFPLPHQHLMDNAVTGVCTAQIIMEKPGIGVAFIYQRDQLNRTYKTRTPKWADGVPIHFEKPDAKLVHAYEKARDEYTSGRNKLMIKKMRENVEIANAMSKRDVLQQVIQRMDDFMDGEKVSVKKIMGEFGVSSHKAYDVKVLVEAERIRRKIAPFSQSRPVG